MSKTYRKDTDMSSTTHWQIRKVWTRSPVQRAHSDHPKGARGYRRADTRRSERNQD